MILDLNNLYCTRSRTTLFRFREHKAILPSGGEWGGELMPLGRRKNRKRVRAGETKAKRAEG